MKFHSVGPVSESLLFRREGMTGGTMVRAAQMAIARRIAPSADLPRQAAMRGHGSARAIRQELGQQG